MGQLKAIAFDLDGTLVDADELHYVALNRALAQCGPQAPITREEHLSTFKGLPTIKKLEILLEAKRITGSEWREVNLRKLQETLVAIKETLNPDPEKLLLLSALKRDGWQICVCSNAMRKSVRAMLEQCQLARFLDFWLSNQDTIPKPAPDMYLLAAKLYGIEASQLVVVEDALPGKQAAQAAGCLLVEVEGPVEVGPYLIPRINAMLKEETYAG